MCMSDLAACAMCACNDLVIYNDAAADTGAERYHDHIVAACSAALPQLTERCDIRIISGLNIQPGHLL